MDRSQSRETDSRALCLLLVEKSPVAALFLASDLMTQAGILVACIEGTPASTLEQVQHELRTGRPLRILYLHDAKTVIYPFTMPPLSTILEQPGIGPIEYEDLGLPPLGASPRRFLDPSLPRHKLLFELSDIPPGALVGYVVRAATGVEEPSPS